MYTGAIDIYILEWVWKEIRSSPELSFFVSKVRGSGDAMTFVFLIPYSEAESFAKNRR